MAPKSKLTNARKSVKPCKFNQNLIFISILIIILAVASLILSLIYLNVDQDFLNELSDYNKYDDLQESLKPFTGDKFEIGQIFKQPFWGSLNSGHYFGLKLAGPKPIETSMIWFRHRLNREGGLNMRHLCNQNDGIQSYSWHRHDFYNFGEQIIKDEGYRFRTSFIKNRNNHFEWKARVELDWINNASVAEPLSIVQYVTINNELDSIEHESNTHDLDSLYKIRGSSDDLGPYSISIKLADDSKQRLLSSRNTQGNIDKRFPVTDYLTRKLERTVQNGTQLFQFFKGSNHRSRDPNDSQGRTNIVAIQLNVIPPFKFEIDLSLISSNGDEIAQRDDYQQEIIQMRSEFDEKFRGMFKFDDIKLSNNRSSNELLKLTQVALSNMLGSIGYFYGESIVGKFENKAVANLYGPIELLSGVPSRSFFPRGFLWDEAFHNILISEWDPSISNKIIRSWFNIMNSNGWIPREVILGFESMRRVPREFIVQYISNANPPAMLLTIDKMFKSGSLEEETFNHIYPRLKAWYRWFEVTQAGLKEFTYRWRGRDELSVSMLNPKTLTSGLDDYPRSSHPSDQEYHVDLRCWMTFALGTLRRLAKAQQDELFLKETEIKFKTLSDQTKLDELHWSSEHNMYCDYGHNTAKISLVKLRKSRGGEIIEEYERQSTGQPEFGCVPEFGYVSLFPMLFNLIEPKSEKLGYILDKLRDPEELWSPYGVRSLSKKSTYYNKYNTQHDGPYWRGAIWMNLNFLILSSLEHYTNLGGPYAARCQQIHQELRHNLINNVLSEFIRTNYMWEQYNDRTGKGQGSHPFTGWTSLILMITSGNRVKVTDIDS